jgi:hypothetical protein
MKKVKKVVALAIGSLMSVSIFAGCSANGLALYSAYSKLQTVKTMETKSDISLNVEALNLSAEEQNILTVLPVINASKISVLTKTKVNEDKTSSQIQSDVKMLLGARPVDTSLWVDADFSMGKNKMKEIVMLPEIVTSKVPELAGKKYFVMDLSAMMNTAGASQVDYAKLSQIGRQLEPKLNQFIDTYVKQYNSNLNIINNLGKKDIKVAGIVQNVDVYELKLDDKSFKDLLKYTINNFGENKDAVLSFLKDYLLAINSIMEASGQMAQLESMPVEEMLNNVSAAFPEVIEQLKQGVNTLDSIKLLGDKGITVQYSVNSQGYIVNQNGSVQLVVDAKSMMNLAKSVDNGQAASMPNYTGTYTITINFNKDTYNINQPVNIEFPVTNEANSVNFMDLIGLNETPNNNPDIAYKKAFNSVQLVVKLAAENNVKPAFFKHEGSLERGSSDSNAVVMAASKGLQQHISFARKQIDALPDSMKNYKETFSSILDNYQNPVYETTVSLINSSKNNPKQSEVIMARILIKDVEPFYKSSYSSALDAIQGSLFNNASRLVDKAAASKDKVDIDKALQAINELKTIPAEFLTSDVANFIKLLEDKLK